MENLATKLLVSLGVVSDTIMRMPMANAFVPKVKKSNKYTPHQGKQECARRVRQMERLAK